MGLRFSRRERGFGHRGGCELETGGLDIEGLFALVEERGSLDTEGGCELETGGLDIESLFALVEERGFGHRGGL